MEEMKINKEVQEVVLEKGKDEVKKKLYLRNMAIENAINKLDRADIVLQHWTQEYSYAEKPDPKAAINWLTENDRSREAKQSAEWFWDYNYIFEFIEIVFDYVTESKEILEKGLSNERE